MPHVCLVSLGIASLLTLLHTFSTAAPPDDDPESLSPGVVTTFHDVSPGEDGFRLTARLTPNLVWD